MADDLDALLDDAMDTLDRQDAVLERERATRELQAREVLEEAARNSGPAAGAGGGDEAKMLKALGDLMVVLQKGPDFMENASDEEMERLQAVIGGTLDTMQQCQGMTDKDSAALNDCRSMLQRIQAGSADDMTPEAIGRMQEELRNLATSGGAGGGGGGGGDETSGGSEAAASPEAVDAVADPVAMLRQLMEPGVMQEPFERLRDAYGPWLAEHSPGLEASERTRFSEQQRLATEICVLIQKDRLCETISEEGGADGTKEEQKRALLDRFVLLVTELQNLGEPPKTLFPSGENN